MCIQSGYKTITPIELSNALFALRSKLITFRAFRIYLGCFSLIAIREAAKRSTPHTRGKGTLTPRYRIFELRRLTGASEKEIRRELCRLKRCGLLTFAESEIEISKSPVTGSEDLLTALSGKRSALRPIPVPRSALRFLASCSKPALTKTMLFYILRGLTIDRKSGEVRGKGTLKLSFATDALGVSERAAKYARSELIKIGWISKDTGSFQRKLNRDGAYFLINLSWINPNSAAYQSNLAANSNESRVVAESQFAPPEAKTCTKFAPPYKEKKTPYGSKDQKTLGAAQIPTGVFSKQFRERKPNIRDVKLDDLMSLSKMEALYLQACKLGLTQASEASALNFLSAAVRAKRVKSGDPVKVFVSILRRKLFHHITQEEEETARRALVRIRAENPMHFKLVA